jgi:hypothetical protein
VTALAGILFGAFLTLSTAYGIGVLVLRKIKAPPELELAAGAALLSVAVFLIVLAGAAGWLAFLVLSSGLLACHALFLRRMRASGRNAASKRGIAGLDVRSAWILLPYAIWYFVNALAPETLPDGLGYHLGLPYKYIRLGGFPARMEFFDAVPQGMEMLYTMAFAFGRHSAARLVEFAFLAATPFLILRIGRKLSMSPRASLVVAAFYFCAPVAGVTGSSSYTDAAMVFFTLAAFYALLEWRESGAAPWLAAAGLSVGFCYSIKVTGAVAVAGAVLFVIAHRRRELFRPAVTLGATAGLVIAPWVVRNWIVTGDPLAPLGNALFPNPYFHLLTEKELGAALAAYGHVPPLRIPWELAFGDGFTGTFGPLLWLLPLGLFALRRRDARLCLAAAVLLALPWWSNRGGRFLMPAVAVAAFPMAMALPARAAWAAIAVQAVVCWPQALNLWQPDWIFRLHTFPVRAALRIEPEQRYLAGHSPEFGIARMVEAATPPAARIFSFDTVANAYLARDVSVSWQSAEGDRMSDSLRLATFYRKDATYAWRAVWPAAPLGALRLRLTASHEGEWDISEIEFAAGAARLAPSPQWTLRAWPNEWEAPLALDRNRATRWRTWAPMRAGMFFEIDFDHPQSTTGVSVASHTPVYNVPLEVYGRNPDGAWQLLAANPPVDRLPDEDLRLQATSALRRAGFTYILIPNDSSNGSIGRSIEADPLGWDMEEAARDKYQTLFRVR